MAHRVLLISYCYPPLAAPESWLAAKGAEGLRRAGAEVHVVAAERRWWHSHDESLVDYARGAATVTTVVTPRWIPFVQPFPATRQFPDPMRFLQRRVVRAVERLDLDSFDAMLSWSQWHSVHLAALEIKRRRPGLRWTAHLSDPWVENPLQPRHALGRLLNRRYERAVMASVDDVEMSSPDAIDALVRRHPDLAGRVHLVPHSFDSVLYRGEAPRDGPILARYLGAFYGGRTPAPLLDGLSLLPRGDADFIVELIGRGGDRLRRSLGDQLDARVRICDEVGYLDSLRLMREADLLLVVDSAAARSVFVASKLVDYVGAARPIVAITPPGAAADLVRALGGWVADPRDPAAIADALRAGIAHAREHRGAQWGSPEVAEALHVDAVGRRRLAMLTGDGPAGKQPDVAPSS